MILTLLLGQSRLREIFLKTENVIGGKYLAEITKEVSAMFQFVCLCARNKGVSLGYV